MKYYLSSYKLGNKSHELARLMPDNKRIGYIPNACDYTHVDVKRRTKTDRETMAELRKSGLKVEILNLKDYFGKQERLAKKLYDLGGVFVRGGNTFILRQAMKLSGFDKIFKQLVKRKDFLYAGYSAGICVLAPDLKSLKIVDDPADKPYRRLKRTVWKGLGALDYMILPHYKSDHPESADINKEVAYCRKNKIPFRTLKDGEVIVIE